jgi:recombination protein RecT
VIDAVTNIAAIGISLNPAKKQAYLVPRDGRICLDISYMGLMDLAMADGLDQVGAGRARPREGHFVLNGFDKPPTHNFSPVLHEPRRPSSASTSSSRRRTAST